MSDLGDLIKTLLAAIFGGGVMWIAYKREKEKRQEAEFSKNILKLKEQKRIRREEIDDTSLDELVARNNERYESRNK